MEHSQPIRLLKHNEGTQYLGLYLTMNRDTKLMEAHLWEKAMVYMMVFQRMPMTHREVVVLYKSCFLPALYPLPATWLPDSFFEKIHQLSMLTILNKMGFHWNLPRTMVFVPRSMGGIGLSNLQHKMEVQQVLILL